MMRNFGSIDLLPHIRLVEKEFDGLIAAAKGSSAKNKLKKQKILRFPGAYNPLTAKLIAEIFPSVPLFPNPPGIKIPEAFLSSLFIWLGFNLSEVPSYANSPPITFPCVNV